MIASSGSCSAVSASLLMTWRRIARLSWRVWSGDQRIDMVFARHRLQRLGGRELGADRRDQRLEQRRLVLAGTARDPDQHLQQRSAAAPPATAAARPACQEIDRAMPR